MTTVSTTEAAETFDALLDRVRAGEEIAVADSGEEIARIVPTPKNARKRKPTADDYAAWFEERRQKREAMVIEGEPMSQLVIRMRREARY